MKKETDTFEEASRKQENQQVRERQALRRYLVKRQKKTFRRNPTEDFTLLFKEYLERERAA